jgi:hypothetical protein
VWFVYRVGRLLWGPRAGLIASAMLAVSPLALQSSRFANVSSETVALWAAGFYFLVMALRYRRWSDWVLSGFLWSLNLYFYPAGKLIIPMAGVIGLYCLIRWRLDFFKQYALGFILLGVTFAVTFMPYAVFSSKENWYSFAGRAGETSIFSPVNQAPTFARYGLPYDPTWGSRSTLENFRSDPVPWIRLVYEQARETTDVMYRRGDQVFYYRMDPAIQKNNGSILSPFWAVLMLLGLAYAHWKLWDARYALVLIWFWFGLAGSILTVDTPNLQRVISAWPAAMLFPAVLLDRIFAGAWPLNLSLARKWAAVPIAVLLLYFGVDSYQEYFGVYKNSCPYCIDTAQARHADTFGQEYKGYQLGVGGYDIYFAYGSTRYLAKGVEGAEVFALADTLPIIDNNGKGAAFIVYPNNAEYLPMLRLMYPGGTEEQIFAGSQEQIASGQGRPAFTSYKIPLEKLQAFQTLHATYSAQGAAPIERDEPGLGTSVAQGRPSWSPPPGLSYPASAAWEGGLVAPAYGTYTFSMQDAVSATLSIDGREVLSATSPDKREVSIVLARGLHDVRLTATLNDAAARAAVVWASSGAPPTPVDSAFLYNGPTGGLSGAVGPFLGVDALHSEEPFASQIPSMRRSDPFVGFREAAVMLGHSPGQLMHWQGSLQAPIEGDYIFSITANGPAVVKIDGRVAIDSSSGITGGPVRLTAGPHQVDIRYVWQSGRATAEWFSRARSAHRAHSAQA